MAKYPTAPTVRGKWNYTLNTQKRVGADKVKRGPAGIARPARATKLPKAPPRGS